MPKLNKDKAAAVESAESASFEVLEEGVYTGKLVEVEVKEGTKGPYWSWKFSELTDVEGKTYPGSQWLNTSLSDAALWKLNETFEGFGVSADTDTDDLIGKSVRLSISRVTIQSGKRAGGLSNQIDAVLPGEPVGSASGAGKGGKGDKPLF